MTRTPLRLLDELVGQLLGFVPPPEEVELTGPLAGQPAQRHAGAELLGEQPSAGPCLEPALDVAALDQLVCQPLIAEERAGRVQLDGELEPAAQVLLAPGLPPRRPAFAERDQGPCAHLD